MRTKLVSLVLLVALAALTLPVSAAAAPGRGGLLHRTTTSAAKPVPAADLVAKSAAMLPGSAYPWVQPVFQTAHGVVVVTLPRTNTQPPAWVLSG
jgi:hypothetical protein